MNNSKNQETVRKECIRNKNKDITSKIIYMREHVEKLFYVILYAKIKKSRDSQTWPKDPLSIATTCQQRPLFCCTFYYVYSTKIPLNNDHLSEMATILVVSCTQVWLCIKLKIVKKEEVRNLCRRKCKKNQKRAAIKKNK